MSLPRFFLDAPPAPPGTTLPLGPEPARHLRALRLLPGAALEVVLADTPWTADLVVLDRQRAEVRLVAPLAERREPDVRLEACLPIPAQLSLFDEWVPPLVELGAMLLQPIVYERSEYDAAKVAARMERWGRLIQTACEQSHRSARPVLGDPLPFSALLAWPTPQRWVAYELPTGAANPALRPEALAFTSGPEGGITEAEFEALAAAGWQAVTLGRSILRAVTAPVALLGAAQFQLGQTRP